MSAELYIARRYLTSRRQGAWSLVVSWMATGSVALGVAALIITLSVMSGFRDDIRSKILGVQPHLLVSAVTETLDPNDQNLITTLNNDPTIAAWAPYAMNQVLIGRGSQSSGAMIKGIDPLREPKVANVEKRLLYSEWPHLSLRRGEKPAIFLGQELAQNIGARLGDTVWVMTPSSLNEAAFSMPKAHLFQVLGLIQTGLYDYDSSLAYIDLQDAQKTFGFGKRVSGIGVRLKNPEEAESKAPSLQQEFAGRYWVRSWLSLNKNLFSALKLEKIVMFIILTMVTLVSSFMIVSNLLLIITQKVREIGILRAIGAPTASIRRLFLYQGTIMGLLGTTIGTVVGIGLSLILSKTNLIRLPADVYYIDHLPVHLDPVDILIVVLAAIAIVFLATLFPSKKATDIDPIEAIRYG